MPTTTAEAPNLDTIAAGLPWRFELVSTDRFFVDPTYQRELTSFVDRIADKFNPALIGVIVASERKVRAKANLAVIDGQTRWQGAVRFGQLILPAAVFTGLTPQQEAEIFAAIQTERRNLSSYERYNAQVVAQNPVSKTIQNVVEGYGFKTGGYSGTDATVISAVAALEAAYAKGTGVGLRRAREGDGDSDAGEAMLGRTLGIIKAAWPNRDASFLSGQTIRGVAQFLADNDPVDDERLIDRLGRITPLVLIQRADQLKAGYGSGGSTGKYVAEAILSQYTIGRSTRRKSAA